MQVEPAGDVGVLALGDPVVEGEHVVASRPPRWKTSCSSRSLLGVLLGEVVAWLQSSGVVVELPDVLVEGALGVLDHLPGDAVAGHGRPALVVDAAVADHLEVLRGVPVLGVGVVEACSAGSVPSTGCCVTPPNVSGTSSPAASRIVGSTSMTWCHWWRTSPRASIPLPQRTIIPSRVPPRWATCLVHGYGVFMASAQPTG